MKRKSLYPRHIFYDSTSRRLQYSRQFFLGMVTLFVTVFSVAVASILAMPELPKLSLPNPKDGWRAITAPNTSPPSTLLSVVPKIPDEKPSLPPGEVMAFFVNWDENSRTALEKQIDAIDILSPEWLHMADESGALLEDDPALAEQIASFARKKKPDIKIVPLLNNFSPKSGQWESGKLEILLANEKARLAMIDGLLHFVESNAFSGVLIDFEGIPDWSQGNLLVFMRELSAVFRSKGLSVFQSIPLDDDSFNAALLAPYSDALVLMAYDEHSPFDTEAGPIASEDWYVSGLTARLREIPAEKVIVALGGYGYDWSGSGVGEVEGKDVTFHEAMQGAHDANTPIFFDKNTKNPMYSYVEENGSTHTVWFLDAATAFNEVSIARRLGSVAGFALWRLGSEDPNIWDVFRNQTKLDVRTAGMLQNMAEEYDLLYEGSGEILRVTGNPEAGRRVITVRKSSGRITNEQVVQSPLSYTITRWGNGETTKKQVAITFDDGPDDEYTPAILDILKKFDARATFFVIGANANAQADLLAREFSEGHEIGSHTFTHPNISLVSKERMHIELDATARLLESVLGRKTLLFRPPYAEDLEPSSPDQVGPLVLANSLGYYTVGMRIDPRDWSHPGKEEIITRVVNGVRRGDGHIVLLHDSGGDRSETLAALPEILSILKQDGYEFVTVSDLMGLSRNDVMPEVPPREVLVARVNRLAFFGIASFFSFVKMASFVGILFGSFRLLCIGLLAIVQRIYTLFRRQRINRKLKEFFPPSVSVIIPAFNEERVVVRTIRSVLASEYSNFDVIVVDDGSTDRTKEQLLSAFGTHPLVRILALENSGKANALNAGLQESVADIVVMLDADTIFTRWTLPRLVERFVDKQVAAVAGNAKVGNRVNILTRWQALEYITMQNMDRRAFELLNAIAVVPGSIGAWRRLAIMEVGGFKNDTLAEDTDLTLRIIRNGWRVVYEDRAIAYTEAPETVRNFLRQRFRWMYGTLQAVWKQRDTLFRVRYAGLGFVTLPNVLLFQVLFPFVSPLIDLALVFSLSWALWQGWSHTDISAFDDAWMIGKFYLAFLAVDFLAAAIPFLLERREQKSLLFWLPFQRFFYRQLMYFVAIRSVMTAFRGTLVGWNKLNRTAHLSIRRKKRLLAPMDASSQVIRE